MQQPSEQCASLQMHHTTVSCQDSLYCSLPSDHNPLYGFPFFVLNMFEVVNNLRNICASIPVTHRMAIVCSVRVSVALFCSRAEFNQPALKAMFLMSHTFWIICGKPEGWHQIHVWIGQIFILSFNIDEDWSLTGHVYVSVPVLERNFHQLIQVGYLQWSKTCR